MAFNQQVWQLIVNLCIFFVYNYSDQYSGIVLHSNLYITLKIHFSTENVQPPELNFTYSVSALLGLKNKSLDKHFLSILVDFYINQKHFIENVQH